MKRLAGTVLATAAVASACSGADVPIVGGLVDPGLVGPDHYREICVSSRYVDAWTIGVATATNASAESLKLTDVRLTEPDGITLEGATFLVRDGRVDSFGVWNGYPPRGLREDPLSAELWQLRQPLGEEVAPGEEMSFLLHLTGAAGATSGPIEVDFEDESGDTGTWASNVRYRIGNPC